MNVHSGLYRPSVLEINLDALAQNYQTIRTLAANAETAAVVKADAYGLGSVQVSERLYKNGCRTFFTAHFEEALTIRTHLKDVEIYALNGLLTATPEAFVAANICPVLNCLQDVRIWQDMAKAQGRTLPCAIHFDTGMNRLGLGTLETETFLRDKAHYMDGLDVRLILSHFSSSDEPGHPATAAQAQRFAFIKTFFPGIRASLCNSAGIFLDKSYHHEQVRCGMALYGLNPTHGTNPLKRVVDLTARVLQTHEVRKHECVGYGARYQAEKNERLATVCVGYADGFFRLFSHMGASLFWNGIPCPLRGRVSMDLITVSIDHIQDRPPQAGDMMEVIGAHQTPESLAALAGGKTSSYELLTALGSRYQRVYL